MTPLEILALEWNGYRRHHHCIVSTVSRSEGLYLLPGGWPTQAPQACATTLAPRWRVVRDDSPGWRRVGGDSEDMERKLSTTTRHKGIHQAESSVAHAMSSSGVWLSMIGRLAPPLSLRSRYSSERPWKVREACVKGTAYEIQITT